MAKLNCLVPGLLLVFAVLTQGSQIGDSCSEDKECDSYTNNHFVCKNQKSCDCKGGYHATTSRDSCQAAINTVCQTQDDCTSLPNSECQKEICVCRPEFVSKYDNLECLEKAKFIGDACIEVLQCQSTFGDQSMCNANKCTCINGYHINRDLKCIKDVGLQGSCSNDEDCYLGNEKLDVISCQNNKCKCREGFVSDGRECVASGNILTASILTLVAWGMVRLFA